ncbi:hypothetical protein HDZ31DRAFT_47392, partial [Schizophyllum fasciatum]
QQVLTIPLTCHVLHAVTKLKNIWIECARRTITANDIFEPTFDLTCMSVFALERVATAPRRFFALVRAAQSGGLHPSRRRTLPIGSSPASPDSYKQVRLVPGGRFLLARSQERFFVFDLSHAPARTLHSALLTRLLDIPAPDVAYVTLEDCYPGAEESSLRIVFTLFRDGEQERLPRFYLMEAFFRRRNDENCVEWPNYDVDIELVAQLSPLVPLNSRPLICFLCDSTAVIHTDVDIIVWDFSLQMVACWRVDSRLEQTIRVVHVAHGQALCALRNIVITYPVPPFCDAYAKGSWDHTSLQLHEVVLSLSESNCAWITARPWHTATSASSNLLALDHFSRTTGLTRYVVDSPASTSGEGHTMPAVHGRWRDRSMCFDRASAWMPMRGYSVVEGGRAVCPYVRTPWGFHVGLLAYGGPYSEAAEVRVSGVESFDRWDACPASGRYCYIDVKDTRTIVVCDCLADSLTAN